MMLFVVLQASAPELVGFAHFVRMIVVQEGLDSGEPVHTGIKSLRMDAIFTWTGKDRLDVCVHVPLIL